MRKVCKACGTELQKDQKFCHVCGLKCDGKMPQPEEQKKEKRILREESLSEKDSWFGKRKTVYYTLYIVFCVMYAVLTVTLALFGLLDIMSILFTQTYIIPE